MNERLTLADVHEARYRLAGVIKPTPLEYSRTISELLGSQVFFKMENLQRTGSFKIRGAYNKLFRLPDASRGVVAASAGNHAQGVALAAARRGVPATVVMPCNAPRNKICATAGYGARVVLAGRDYWDACRTAARIAEDSGALLVPAFEDPDVIAGQGTIGFEILERLPDIDAVLVPMGGGGLISGIGLVIKTLKPGTRVIGVAARAAPALFLSRRAGGLREIPVLPTLADGIAVKRPGKLNFRYIQEFVDDIVLVDEPEIAQAILLILSRAKVVVEGAGAVGLAALLAGRVNLHGRKLAVVLSGGNIDAAAIAGVALKGKKLLTRQDIGAWRRKKASGCFQAPGSGTRTGFSAILEGGEQCGGH